MRKPTQSEVKNKMRRPEMRKPAPNEGKMGIKYMAAIYIKGRSSARSSIFLNWKPTCRENLFYVPGSMYPPSFEGDHPSLTLLPVFEPHFKARSSIFLNWKPTCREDLFYGLPPSLCVNEPIRTFEERHGFLRKSLPHQKAVEQERNAHQMIVIPPKDLHQINSGLLRSFIYWYKVGKGRIMEA
ncbi:uncharacterized protein MELLADRAFT_110398 [Melampsora larici-populina 98AG31]|uniref:Uncharacterized protein n=1 Tax=Melampsora larici-populina (strain 98AG31 / pathotype 3-4-7) TaxID=747676 RepID=F4RZP3_MELLP|nr:uncharacterized protein MELLADRAFT_110398 [Melampsora larici-populina 98AG31]EGG02151.1 hypothetical protein MELLADRAFT_110398 [Melampsora larici-populina 98AG31]